MIRLKASLILNKDLIGISGWLGMRARDKLPLDNSMKNDETQAAWH
jgi:hypothetical protein